MHETNKPILYKIKTVRQIGTGFKFIVRPSRGNAIFLDEKNLLGNLSPIPGYYLVSCTNFCACANTSNKPTNCIHNHRCEIPCREQCFYVMPKRTNNDSNGPRCLIITDVTFTQWPKPKFRIIHKQDKQTTIPPERILACSTATAPEIGKYLVPCELVCSHRGDKCIRRPDCNCDKQFFYVRKNPVYQPRGTEKTR